MFTNARRRIALLLVAALTLVAHAGAQRGAASALEVPFQLVGNHVVVPVKLQGRDLSFVLDTGAGNSLIDLGRARELALKLGQPIVARGAGPGGTPGAMLPEPPIATVGTGPGAVDVRINAALDFETLSRHGGRDLDGILGGDFIRRFVVEIDYEHLRLRLHAPATFDDTGRGTTLPLTFNMGFPHVRATLKLSEQESFVADCVLDVGSALQVIVTNPIVESRGLAGKLSASQPIPIGRGAGGTSDGRVARLPALLLGDLSVYGPVAILAGTNAGVLSTSQSFEANIGTGVMRHFTVFFDYGRSRVTFAPNGLGSEPFEHDMAGLVLTTEGRPYAKRLVESVVEGMPAAAAGIKPGDRIKSIDDAGADALSMDAIRKLFLQHGRTYRIVIERDGKDVTLTLTTRRLV